MFSFDFDFDFDNLIYKSDNTKPFFQCSVLALFFFQGALAMFSLWVLMLELIRILPDVAEGDSISGVAINNTLNIGYLLPWSVGWNVGPFMGSAIMPAIEEVKRRQLLSDYEIDFIFRDSGCEILMGKILLVEAISMEHISYIAHRDSQGGRPSNISMQIRPRRIHLSFLWGMVCAMDAIVHQPLSAYKVYSAPSPFHCKCNICSK